MRRTPPAPNSIWRSITRRWTPKKWLLDNVAAVPSRESLDNIASVLRRTQGRHESDHHRKLDQGGTGSRFTFKRGAVPGARFQELEGNIAALSAKIEAVSDAKEASRLQMALDTLEDLLKTLQES